MSAFHHETVTAVHHWTGDLFSFTTSRDPSFRFDSGQFVMMGLEIDGRPLTRAYSMASAIYDDTLATPQADPIICVVDFATNYPVTAGNFTIQWAATGIFRISLV